MRSVLSITLCFFRDGANETITSKKSSSVFNRMRRDVQAEIYLVN